MKNRLKNQVLLLLLLTAACSPAAISEITPTVPPPQTSTPTQYTPPAATQAPTSLPEDTRPGTFVLDGYALTYNGMVCPLRPVEFYGLHVFQADCGEPVYLPQGTAIRIGLETPRSEVPPITPIPDIASIFGALEPAFLFCEFGGVGDGGMVTFGTPFQQVTGRDILCGFRVTVDGQDAILVLTGLTTRSLDP